jgi:antirestriction protein
MSDEQSPNPEAAAIPEQAEQSGLRLYVASLTDYNHGVLHGRWIDLDGDQEAMWSQVQDMLAASPTARQSGSPAEEWAIHDSEGFGGTTIDEFESLDQLSAIAGRAVEHGQPFMAWAGLVGIDVASSDEATERFEDSYWGQFDSAEEFGETLIEATGFHLDELPGIPESIRPYVSIDVAGWVRDMRLNGEIEIADAERGIYVFFVG